MCYSFHRIHRLTLKFFSESNELRTAANDSKSFDAKEKKAKFKHLYSKLKVIKNKWQDMVVLSSDMAEVLVR